MTLSSKAQDIERNFQTARAKANYITFHDLARRYVKHNKDGAGNERMLCTADQEGQLSSRKPLLLE